jgi:signal transduction histidine kinase
VLPQLRRRPAAVAGQVAEAGAKDVPLEDVLLRSAELLRSSLAADRAQVWASPAEGGGLARVIALPGHDGATSLGASDLRVLAGAGVAGRAWLELWLPALLTGIDTPHVRIAAAVYQDSALGMLLVTRPRAAEPFGPDDDVALGETAARLAVVLHNRRLDSALRASLADLQRANEALAASRRRLVTAADTERRRIERDLHDGAQQHLVALAVNLSVARGLLAQDPQQADEILAAMADQVRDAVRELRDLAHGIYPALLKEGGLEQALRSALTRLGPNVRTSLSDLGRFEPAIEAALYFCCIEAVQNSAKHAPGASVLVSAGTSDGSVWFAVTDDGPGFDPAVVQAGFGQVSMTDRIGALGGSIRWETAPGRGTTVRGHVPVRR